MSPVRIIGWAVALFAASVGILAATVAGAFVLGLMEAVTR